MVCRVLQTKDEQRKYSLLTYKSVTHFAIVECCWYNVSILLH